MHAESAVHVAWQLVWGFAEVVLLVNEPWLLALSTHAPLPTSVYEVPGHHMCIGGGVGWGGSGSHRIAPPTSLHHPHGLCLSAPQKKASPPHHPKLDYPKISIDFPIVYFCIFGLLTEVEEEWIRRIVIRRAFAQGVSDHEKCVFDISPCHFFEFVRSNCNCNQLKSTQTAIL